MCVLPSWISASSRLYFCRWVLSKERLSPCKRTVLVFFCSICWCFFLDTTNTFSTKIKTYFPSSLNKTRSAKWFVLYQELSHWGFLCYCIAPGSVSRLIRYHWPAAKHLTGKTSSFFVIHKTTQLLLSPACFPPELRSTSLWVESLWQGSLKASMHYKPCHSKKKNSFKYLTIGTFSRPQQ